VQMFRSKKIKPISDDIGRVKDWRDAGHDLEVLGIRLDKARAALNECKKGTWAHDFWATTVARLFTKWSLTLQLKDTGMRQIIEKHAELESYDWWEKSDEIRMVTIPGLENMFHNAGLSQRLDESWAKSKELKLEKARIGLA